jgi:hypothetical protein
LAEAQAAEDLRRRDPVKRALWAAALLISLMLAWSSWLQLKAMSASQELGRVQAQMNAHTNEYKHVMESQRKADDIKSKLAALRQLSANRFLQASLLNALQQPGAEDVQLVHLRSEQSYAYTEATKTRTNDNRVVLGRPASATERVVITLDASDSSSNPGDQVNKFEESLAAQPYVHELLGKTNMITLKHVSPHQFLSSPGSTVSKESVLFTLECRLPERTR